MARVNVDAVVGHQCAHCGCEIKHVGNDRWHEIGMKAFPQYCANFNGYADQLHEPSNKMNSKKYLRERRARRLFGCAWKDIIEFSLRRILELPGKLIRVNLGFPDDAGDIGFSWRSPDGERWLLISRYAPVAYRLDEKESIGQVSRRIIKDQWQNADQSRDFVDFVFGRNCPKY